MKAWTLWAAGLSILLAVVGLDTGAALAGVITFQNGVGPTKEYAGCKATLVSMYNAAESKEAARAGATELRTFSTSRRVLVSFDLSDLPKDQVVRRALLRVYPVRPVGLKGGMTAYPLTHEWDQTATGMEFKKTDDDKSPEGNWAKPGGDYDETAGIKSPIKAGTFGHAMEFDVTELVKDWGAGKRPNHGVLLMSGRDGAEHPIAACAWPIAEYRPALLVDVAPAAEASAESPLKPLPVPAKDIALSDVAKTADAGGAAAEYATLRMGAGDTANLCSGFGESYRKGWAKPGMATSYDSMPMIRVGGGAGSFNAAELTYDLAGLPAKASIRSAKLRLCVVDLRSGNGIRFGAYAQGATGSAAEAPLAVALLTPTKEKDKDTWLEWDVTGAVRAAAGKSLALRLRHDLEGGAFDAYGCRYDVPAKRPVLEIEVSPPTGPLAAPKLTATQPANHLPGLMAGQPTINWSGLLVGQPTATMPAPAGDYWVEAMRAAHKKFKGTKGALGQYGDSITITMAYLAPHSYGKSIVPAKCPDDVKARLEIVQQYVDRLNTRKLWRDWKDPKYGNNGSMTVNWAFNNIDKWQETCKPEVCVILFGTNDVSAGPHPPEYTEQMGYVIDRCLADGTIPMLTTLPPHGGQKGNPGILRTVTELRRAQLGLARAKKIPLIDLYQEMLTRQPENWDKTLMGDTLHPSYPKDYQMDFTEEGLKNSGYTLRSYLTFMRLAEVIEKVLLPAEAGGK